MSSKTATVLVSQNPSFYQNPSDTTCPPGPPPPYPGTSPRQDGSPYSMDQQASTMDGTYCQLLASSPTNYPSIPISIMAPQDG